MITYFLNWMGPLNKKWIEENGSDWSCGRIDIDGVPGEPFGIEYSISPMKNNDWASFASWLNELETKEVWSLERLLKEYELENRSITWLKNDK